MIKRIENWFSNYREKQRRKQILKIIKKAKQSYLDGKENCMCFCFERVESSFFCYKDIVKRIPEFTPPTFGLPFIGINGVWWPIEDRKSRIKAFDELIEIYSK